MDLQEVPGCLPIFWQPLEHIFYKVKEEAFIIPFKRLDGVFQPDIRGN
jgi:hypothetical protein